VLKLATVAELNSATAKKGDDVPLQLTRPLVVDGITLLQAGAQIKGRVRKVKRAGSNCGSGLIEWDVAQVRFPDSSMAQTEAFYLNPPEADFGLPERLGASDHRWIAGMKGGRQPSRFDVADIFPIILLSPVIVPFFLFDLVTGNINGRGNKPCAVNGLEYHYPVGSTVGVVVLKEHVVRY
jgi:hypothetical protein